MQPGFRKVQYHDLLLDRKASKMLPEPQLTRQSLATLINGTLRTRQSELRLNFDESGQLYFIVDDLLPRNIAMSIANSFPSTSAMTLRSSIRERKYVTAQLNKCDKLVEEIVFAFQDPRLVQVIGEITKKEKLEPDANLYAGGISVMTYGHFLNPHLDNSHDMARRKYRTLNLLYYVTPEWKQEYGGNLELWPKGVTGHQITVPSVFNRLVVMSTNRMSWHSVSEVRSAIPRLCVSNYFFSTESPEGDDYFHPTAFRGRPEQPIRDMVLRCDAALRSGIRLAFRKGVFRNWHFYRKG